MSDESTDNNSDTLDDEGQGKTLYDFLDKFDGEDYKVFIREFKEMALETRNARLAESNTFSLRTFFY